MKGFGSGFPLIIYSARYDEKSAGCYSYRMLIKMKRFFQNPRLHNQMVRVAGVSNL